MFLALTFCLPHENVIRIVYGDLYIPEVRLHPIAHAVNVFRAFEDVRKFFVRTECLLVMTGMCAARKF